MGPSQCLDFRKQSSLGPLKGTYVLELGFGE